MLVHQRVTTVKLCVSLSSGFQCSSRVLKKTRPCRSQEVESHISTNEMFLESSWEFNAPTQSHIEDHGNTWKPQLPIFFKDTFLWVHGLISGPAVLSDYPVVVRCISSDFASLFVECETYSLSWYLQNRHGLYVTWLVVWIIFYFPIILGISSYIGNNHTQLTFIFFRGVGQPPTSHRLECRVHLQGLVNVPWLGNIKDITSK